MRPIAIDQLFFHCGFCSRCPCRYQLAVTNGIPIVPMALPSLTVRLVLAFWQFLCFCLLDMCGSVSVKGDKYISLSVGFRAQNNNRSTDNVRSRLPLVRTKFRFARHFDYPGYQRFFLACDGELRFVGHRPKTRAAKPLIFKTWPKAETALEKPLAPRVHFDRIRK